MKKIRSEVVENRQATVENKSDLFFFGPYMAKFSSDTDCQFLHQNSRLGKFRLNLPVHFCALPGDGADVPRGPFPGGPVWVLGKCSPYPAATDFYGTEATAAAVCKGLNVGSLDGREAQSPHLVCIWDKMKC